MALFGDVNFGFAVPGEDVVGAFDREIGDSGERKGEEGLEAREV